MKVKKSRVKSTLSVQQFLEEFSKELNDPDNLLNLEYELGIDEAGRGPVLGSMVYSALWWPKKYKESLSKLGFADSKELNEDQRDQLFEVIS